MSGEPLPIYRFQKGLQTKAGEDFQQPDEFRVFQNVRVRNGNAKRRAGQALLAQATSDAGAQNFDGTNDVITVPGPAAAWVLPLRFSLRFLISGDDTPAGDEYILGWSSTGNKPITIKRTSGRIITVDFWDSAGTQTTLTSTTATTNGTSYACMVTRSTSTLKLWVNEAVEDTDTVSATLLGRTPADSLTFGAHNGANFWDGTTDHVDLQDVCLTDNNDGFLRLTDPKADPVLACYTFEKDSNNLVTDHSRYGLTGLASGSSDASALCVAEAPILMLAPWVTAAGAKKVLQNAGGRVTPVTLA